MRTIDIERILGGERPMQAGRLLGTTPEETFRRVMAHVEPGCCRKHDEFRAAQRRKAEKSLAHGEPRH